MFTSMILMALIGAPLMLVPLLDNGGGDDENDVNAAGAADVDTGEAAQGPETEGAGVDTFLSNDETSGGDLGAAEVDDASRGQVTDTAGVTADGSVEADVITGGSLDDELSGYYGDDTIYGDEGDDALRGGYGNDVLYGGEGDDNLNGNAGNDYLDGGAGDDRIDSGEGDNTLIGGEGADLLMATLGDDVLNGNEDDGSSDDEIDRLIASFGDDTLMLGEGDIGTGGAGADAHYILADVDLGVTITDFDPAEDSIIVLHDEADVPTITEQRIDATGVTVVLSTGVEIALNGLESTVPAAQFGFEAFGAVA
jgi:Ca2+-binding RTX toxin-like protein